MGKRIISKAIFSHTKTRLVQIGVIIAAAVLIFFQPGRIEICSAESKTSTVTSSGDYLHETAFTSDHDLTGMLSSCSESFYTGDWNYSEATLTLFFSTTSLARREISDFTVSLNGNRFYSSRLPDDQNPDDSDDVNELSIKIPSYLINNGINTITIESYIRTNESSNCSDNISDATWMTIFKDSYVSITYKPQAEIHNIADCYKQFTSIDALENNQSAVFINEMPTDIELSAAAYVLSGMSANAVYDYQNIQLIRSADYAKSTDIKYGIYISQWDKLPESLKAQLPESVSASLDEGKGVIYLVQNDGQFLIVLTGKEKQSMLNAAKLFGNQALVSQTLYSWRSVSKDENVAFDHTLENDDSVLTKTGTYLYGPFRQSTDYYISRGSNLLVDSGSSVTINFRYARNLDFDRSMMTVYIGDTPIGSVKLSANRANGDSVTFNIPDNMDFSGTFTLRVAFDLEIKDLPCTIRSEEMPWAYITPESTLHLETSESPYLLFDYYPAPFVNNGRLNKVKICIPDDFSDTDLKVVKDISMTFGRYIKDNSGSISVSRISTAGELTDFNIVSIGTYENNIFAKQLNDKLFFQFSPKGTTFVSNEKKNIEPNYGSTLGTGQLLYSPYSENNRAFLLISGINDTGMQNADRYLGDSSMVYSVAGDGFVADADDIYYYRFKPDNSKTGSIIYRILNDHYLSLLILTSILVIIIIIIYAILRYMRNRRERR